MRSLILPLLLACAVASTPSAKADVMGVTGVFAPGFDTNPELDGQTLTGVTRDGKTWSTITGATFAGSSGSTGSLFGAVNEGVPANSAAALSGLGFTTGRANMQQTDYDLGKTLNLVDTDFIFFGEVVTEAEIGTNTVDSVRVIPLSGGVAVDTWFLDISTADYGAASAVWDSNFSSNLAGRMTSFELSDFTGGTVGTLVNVDGIRLVDNVGGVSFDPIIVGTASVPEPGSLALIAIGLGGVALWNRKRFSKAKNA